MRKLFGLTFILLSCSLFGCKLFEDVNRDSAEPKKNKLSKLPVAPNAIEVQIGHVRRYAGDPLINERLWTELNQVVPGENDENWRRLQENGFRIGVAATLPPDSLIELLQPGSADATSAKRAEQVHMHSVLIPEGVTTQLTASPHFKHCQIRLAGSNDTQGRGFDFAQGMYRLTARKDQDGWVELEFTPVINHAVPKFRHTAGENGTYTMRNGQKQKVFHAERFKVRVMVGEWVVIGGAPDRPGTLGHQFYFGSEADDLELQAYQQLMERNKAEESDETAADEDEDAPPVEDPQFQRLLVLRVSNINEAILHK